MSDGQEDRETQQLAAATRSVQSTPTRRRRTLPSTPFEVPPQTVYHYPARRNQEENDQIHTPTRAFSPVLPTFHAVPRPAALFSPVRNEISTEPKMKPKEYHGSSPWEELQQLKDELKSAMERINRLERLLGNKDKYKVCYRCNRLGHTMRQCPISPSDSNNTRMYDPVCFRCNQEGHVVQDCPQWRHGKKARISEEQGRMLLAMTQLWNNYTSVSKM